MRKSLLILFLLFGICSSYAQDSSKTIFGVAKSICHTYIKSSYPPYELVKNKYVSENNLFIIYAEETNTIQTKEYSSIYDTVQTYKAFYQNKSVYVLKKDIFTDSLSLYRLKSTPCDTLYKRAKKSARLLYIHALEDLLSYLNKNKKKGILFYNYNDYKMSEYTESKGFTCKLINVSGKTIKYITFNVSGYNAVGDAVTDIKHRKVIPLKGIGPIPPLGISSYDFDYVWFNDLVDWASVRSIKLDFTDGTSSTIKEPNVTWIDRNKLSNCFFDENEHVDED